jgi:hypothetical protein
MIDILIISLFCNGWYLITRDGMLLDPIRKFYLSLCGGLEYGNGDITWNNKIWRFIYQPIFGCIICMSSVIGSVAYWTLNDFTQQNLTKYPIYIICVAFVNWIFYLTTKKLE